LKTLVLGYDHVGNDKRVVRTVNAFRKLGPVYYQSSSKSDFRSCEKVWSYVIDKVKMQGLSGLQKRRNFDKHILELVSDLDYDFVYFHGFPHSMPLKVFRCAKERGKKIFYDLHEIIPVQFLPEQYSFLNPILWQILKAQLSLVAGVIGVSGDAMKMIFDKTEISKPLLIVPNYANDSFSLFDSHIKREEIAIVGGSSRKTLINSDLLRELKKDFRLISIGAKCDIADECLPFMDYDLMMRRIASVQFTLLSYQNRLDEQYANEIYSLPNRFYDSLAAGTPILLAKRFVTMRKIIERTHTGLVLDLLLEPDECLPMIRKALNSYDNLLENLRIHHDEFVWNTSKENEFVNFITTVLDN